ncbi:hypothetical protein AYO36_01675 [Exiguobacterium sp. KKBO11]|uniref:DUF6470 family protein n=1 Tax=Exiguobacterium sp. KKBO11 TaxID=1805000 RepID=UPI0007D7A891|nr:DUF6470 family protein [Exiguobacterium sp. KKBO11]OAI88879.1 hypothetical protein AYO36_01675 [Exiguobacterium sp. KKBO11]
MNLPHLEIRQTAARIGMNITRPQIEQKQTPASLSIEQPRGELSIETVAARLEIDSTQAWIEMGRVPALESVRQYATYGRQKGQEAVAKRSSEGDQLMRIEQGGGTVARIAKANDTPPAEVTTLGFIPRSLDRVKTTYTPAEVRLSYTANRPKIDVETHRPELTVKEGQVDIYLQEQNQLNMWPVGGIFDGEG